MAKYIYISLFLIGTFWSAQTLAEENPDELYEQGRFADAEEAYSRLDMDHPKDIRYRYNRGCAAYQNADYQGAAAAFSSVMKRTEGDQILYGAAYNLGNAAFKQGDYSSAADHFRQAIIQNPEKEDARHNLELTLKEIEKQKQQEAQDQKDQSKEQGDPSQRDEKEGEPGSEKESAQNQDPQKEEEKQESGQQEEPQKDSAEDRESKEGGEEPEDLEGELGLQENLPQENEKEEPPAADQAAIDRKMAEALLDNIKEDRSRFMRFQVPEDKKHGIMSGKDW